MAANTAVKGLTGFAVRCLTRWSHALYIIVPLLIAEAALCAIIITRKQYTKIDWDA